jgi:PKD repeat protein
MIKRNMIIIIIVLILIGIGSALVYNINTTDRKVLIAKPEADKSVARMGEDISFTAENSIGEIKHFSWYFGDGNISNNISFTHVFDYPGWYNVTLTVSNENIKDESTIVIGIQREDWIRVNEIDRERSLYPIGIGGAWVIVMPNIGTPTIEVQCLIQNAVGDIGLWIEAQTLTHGETIHMESTTAFGEDLTFYYTVNPEDLPLDTTLVNSFVLINAGRIGSATVTVEAFFPMEDLTVGEFNSP